MKLLDLFESDYEQRIRNNLLDLITSLFSKGVKKVGLRQVATFLLKKGMSLTPEQVEDLLDTTDFELDGSDVVRKKHNNPLDKEEKPLTGMPDPEATVNNMAQNQIAKGNK